MTTKTKTAAEIAQLLQGTVHGDANVALTGFAPADQARPGDLTFAENEDYFRRAEQSEASAILVSNQFPASQKTLIQVANARVAFAKILPVFFPVVAPPAGAHPSAAIDPTAQVDPTAHIGPHCVVGAGARIGPRAVLLAGVYVGENVQLGEDVWLFPQVTVYPRSIVGHRVRIHAGTVVGSDGFGYVFAEGGHVKVPQVGNVVIQDDVEIGANVTIDRGALGSTVIGRGSKIDNLVQIAHNVVLGEHCILVAQVGVAGSTQVGNFVTMAGQVGVAGHLKIGHQAVLGAQAGVMHNVPDKEKWLGAPAQPTGQFMRQVASLKRLPELMQKVGRLEKELAELKASLPSTTPQ